MKRIAIVSLALLAAACSSNGGSAPSGPGPATHLALTLPADLNAGVAAIGDVLALDAKGATATSYAGSVKLTSTDTTGTVPATVAMAAGHGTFPVTFASLGAATVSAADSANASIAGTATVQVHGLVYTDPSTTGAVKLVRNADFSSASLVQLDLVAGKAVPAGFAVGMNLPLDTSRVGLFATPLVEGNVFNPGAAPKAEAIRLAAGVLYSGLSQKAGGAGAVAHDVAVSAGGIYYSVRVALAPGAAVGTVFDGSARMPGFRAAVRDLLGNDAVGQSDFAVGKLEVR
ncbi:MAG TPA: hypothetical protein VFE90_00790 [Myxococcales bacterium]|nr:hypothetical protein [Myxococcales bacterium]